MGHDGGGTGSHGHPVVMYLFSYGPVVPEDRTIRELLTFVVGIHPCRRRYFRSDSVPPGRRMRSPAHGSLVDFGRPVIELLCDEHHRDSWCQPARERWQDVRRRHAPSAADRSQNAIVRRYEQRAGTRRSPSLPSGQQITPARRRVGGVDVDDGRLGKAAARAATVPDGQPHRLNHIADIGRSVRLVKPGSR